MIDELTQRVVRVNSEIINFAQSIADAAEKMNKKPRMQRPLPFNFAVYWLYITMNHSPSCTMRYIKAILQRNGMASGLIIDSTPSSVKTWFKKHSARVMNEFRGTKFKDVDIKLIEQIKKEFKKSKTNKSGIVRVVQEIPTCTNPSKQNIEKIINSLQNDQIAPLNIVVFAKLDKETYKESGEILMKKAVKFSAPHFTLSEYIQLIAMAMKPDLYKIPANLEEDFAKLRRAVIKFAESHEAEILVLEVFKEKSGSKYIKTAEIEI